MALPSYCELDIKCQYGDDLLDLVSTDIEVFGQMLSDEPENHFVQFGEIPFSILLGHYTTVRQLVVQNTGTVPLTYDYNDLTTGDLISCLLLSGAFNVVSDCNPVTNFTMVSNNEGEDCTAHVVVFGEHGAEVGGHP